jgi:hypothetical protein
MVSVDHFGHELRLQLRTATEQGGELYLSQFDRALQLRSRGRRVGRGLR